MKVRISRPLVFLGATILVSSSALCQSVVYKFTGSQGDYMGSALAAVGDLNQDGFEDFIIGAQKALSSVGQAYVHSGADGSVLFTHTGYTPSGQFGSNAAGIGDVNGDSYPDYAISAFQDSTSGADAGAVYTYSGFDGSLLHTFLGEVNWDFGSKVAGAGDVDADGVPDIIIGAKIGPTGAGLARVYSGASAALIHEFLGDHYQDQFGNSVDGAGDINGDGHADLVIGAPTADPGGDRSGQARVFSGADGSILLEFNGAERVGLLGESVSGIGDVDSDGVPDLAIAAPREDSVVNSEGIVRIHSGATGELIYSVKGRAILERFGIGLDGGKDVNGDGIPDWVGGGPAYSGFAPAVARVYDGASGVLLFEVTGDGAGDNLGQDVALLGDVTGNGNSEVGVGASRALSSSGIAQVLTIDCTGGATNYCVSSRNVTGMSALMGMLGSNSISSNDFVLTATGGVPGRFGVFCYSREAGQVPYGNGSLCLSPGADGIIRLPRPTTMDATGSTSRWIDFNTAPANSSAGHIVAGSTWNFQLTYRDPQLFGFNASDGLRVTFCP